MSAAPEPPPSPGEDAPPIPPDHPLRSLHEARRQALLIEIHALDRALGLATGTAWQRRRARRAGEPAGPGDGPDHAPGADA